jgi:GH15 family glucan-1,4-alpha-glucosidase
MARALVLGNGKLLVNFDERLVLRELYFPHVGQRNHVEGQRNVPGLWVDGSFSWLSAGEWQHRLAYREDSLVTQCEVLNPSLGVSIEVSDAVHYRENLLVRRFAINNLALYSREVRLFLPCDLCIDGSDVGDTAFYHPPSDALIHFKGKRAFLLGGRMEGRGMHQYSTGRKRFLGAEGTFKDAEDGWLEENPIAQGAVDSVAAFAYRIPAQESAVAYSWLAVGDTLEEVIGLHHLVLQKHPSGLMEETDAYWRHWVDPQRRYFADLSGEVASSFKRSLLLIRTQVDAGGGILAANDTDILETNRDHYSYVWPRDGAMVAQAMEEGGYPQVSRNFFAFCRRAITPGGYFWHKYQADGSLGSSWHPWIREGRQQLPIQEDGTALVILALGEHYRRTHDLEYAASLYPVLVKPAADFMAGYRGSHGLPLPSYDLWEERRGIFTFTAAAVCRALEAAAVLGELLKDRASVLYAQAAHEVRRAVLEHLYRPDLGCFARGLYPVEAGGWEYDLTLDSSTLGVSFLGFLPSGDARVVQHAQKVESGLWVKTSVGGLARYPGDYYFRRGHDLEQVPGNPWIVCTLWLASWHIARAEEAKDLEFPRSLIRWAAQHATGSGMLPEQLDPFSGAPLSVSPLTWSHGELVAAVTRYVEKYHEIFAGTGKRVTCPYAGGSYGTQEEFRQ